MTNRPDSGTTGGGVATGGGFVTAGGSTAGGSTAGGSTAGGSTAGGSTAGGSAGGSTAGGSTAGGSTAGGSTAGGSTAGGSTAGGSTAGGSTAGGSTAGGSTAGGSTAGGSTAGGSTAGGTAVAGEVCSAPIPLTAGVMVNGDTTTATNDYRFIETVGTSCASSTTTSTAGDLIYSITVPPNSRLTATLVATFDSTINLIATATNCGDLTGGAVCVAAADLLAIGSNEIVQTETGGSAQTFLIAVDGYASADFGTFTLRADVVPVPPGEGCVTAEVLTLPASRAADTLVGYVSDIAPGGANGCATGTTGADRMYSVIVPAGSRLTVTASASASTLPDGGAGMSFEPTLNIVSGSDCPTTGTQCIAGANSAGTPGTATATFDNVGTAPRTVTVVVDTAVSPTSGTFSLTATAAAITLPVGDVCGNVGPAITATTTLQSEAFVGFADQYRPAGQASCSYLSGLDRVYAVTIPVGQVLTATATPVDGGVLPDGGALNLALSVVSPVAADGGLIECSVGPCLAGSDSSAGGFAETVVSSNAVGTSPANVLLVVDSNAAAAVGTYALNVNLSAAPEGDRCSDTSPAITASTSQSSTLATVVNDYSEFVTGCQFGDGSDRAFRIVIPAGNRLIATTSMTADDHMLSLVGGPAANCAAPSMCLAAADSNLTAAGETLRYDNLSSMPLTVFLVVDDYEAGAGGSFALTVDLSPAPPALVPGDTCGTPAVLPVNGTFLSDTAGRTSAFSFASGMGCAAASTAPDGVFELTVPPNSSTEVTTTATWTVVLNVVDSPATNCGTGTGTGIVCVANSNTFGNVDTVNVVNATSNPRTVFLLVDGSTSTSSGAFEIRTVTTVLPTATYTKTVITPACATLSVGADGGVGTNLIPSLSDDSASARIALPFAFEFFGEPVTHFAGSSNGNVQLFNSGTGSVSTAYANVAIPTAATPNGFVAPFWEDLNVGSVSGTTPAVRYEVTGTTPARVLVVEWNDMSVATFQGAGSLTEQLRFQAKFFETTNVIEFHYCTLSPGSAGTPAVVTGGGATIGLENLSGIVGVQHSFNTPMSVSTTDALQFTP